VVKIATFAKPENVELNSCCFFSNSLDNILTNQLQVALKGIILAEIGSLDDLKKVYKGNDFSRNFD